MALVLYSLVVVTGTDSVHRCDEGLPQLTSISVVDCCQRQSGRRYGVWRTREDTEDKRKCRPL